MSKRQGKARLAADAASAGMLSAAEPSAAAKPVLVEVASPAATVADSAVGKAADVWPCTRCSDPDATCPRHGGHLGTYGVTRYRKCKRCGWGFTTYQPHAKRADGTPSPERLTS